MLEDLVFKKNFNKSYTEYLVQLYDIIKLKCQSKTLKLIKLFLFCQEM